MKILKILFAHDHRFYLANNCNNGVYSEVGFPYRLWRRYLKHFDHLVVAARLTNLREDQNINSMVRSSGDKVEFVSIPDIKSPVKYVTKRKDAKNKLHQTVKECDGIIARLPSSIGSMAITIGAKLGKPCAVEVVGHAWDSFWNYGTLLGKIYAPIATWQTKEAVQQSTHVIYVTKEYLQEKYPAEDNAEVAVASNVELDIMPQDILDKRILKIKRASSPVKIGLIGTLQTSYKGIDTALKALKLIRHKLPPFEFHVLGGGDASPWKDISRKLGLEEETHFDGVLESSELVNDWLDDKDLYLQPSKTEGLPRALIEAMSRGCPAIASTAGGIPELLPQSCLHHPKDEKQLATLIYEGITNKEWQLEQAKSNFKRAKEYSKEQLEQKRNEFWKSFYEYILQSQK